MNSVEIIELKTKKQPLSIILQVIFVIGVLIAGIMTLFSKQWMPLLYGMLTVTLAVMAWNNYKLSKRKWVALLYVVFSLITFGSMIWELL